MEMPIVSQEGASSYMVVPRKRVKKATKKAAKKTYLAKPRTTIAAEVRKALDKLTESKTTSFIWTQNLGNGLANYVNLAAFNTANMIPLFPLATYWTLSQGVGQGERIGNSIRSHKLIYTGVLGPNAYDATYNAIPQPQEVLFMVLRRKDLGDGQPTSLTSLYEVGNGVTSPTGAMIDVLREINEDLYDVPFKRLFKVGPAVNDGSGNSNTYQRFANNDFKYNCKFRMDLTKYIDKIVRFNDASTSQVGAKCYYWAVWMPVNAAATAGGANDRPVQLTSQLIYHYKDA